MKNSNFDSLLWRVENYPQELINLVVGAIPQDLIDNPKTTFADFAMGGGQFLQGVLSRCVLSGHSKEQVLPRLYGFERSLPYLDYARWKNGLLGANFSIFRPEVDSHSIKMEFDVIIGNPPYSLPKGQKAVSDGTVNLSLKFIERSASLLKEGGFISMLTPLNFLKPTDKEKPTRSFSVMEGLSLLSVDTGLEDKWFPGIKTKISLWSATKGTSSDNFTLNGVEWSLSKIPFILDLGPEELKVFKKIWDGMLSGGNPVCCKRVKDGDLYADQGWSLTERVNRRTGKQFIMPWSEKPVREKYEQIHISLDPEKANAIFSKPHIRFFVKAVHIEPTVYHNLFNGLDLGDQTFSKKEQKIIDSYLGDLV